MAQFSSIEWTDHTFNPWWGCTKISPACDHCYAETWARRLGFDIWTRGKPRRFLSDAYWRQPRRWNDDAASNGRRARVFCASMADVFEWHRGLQPWRQRLWHLIDETPNLDWLLLTKRPHLAERLAPWDDAWPDNVWLGTTVEDQRWADKRLPKGACQGGTAVLVGVRQTTVELNGVDNSGAARRCSRRVTRLGEFPTDLSAITRSAAYGICPMLELPTPHAESQHMADAVSHDQNFKNLILDYPHDALAFFAPEEAPGPHDDVRIVPARQEQLTDRLGDSYRALDAPLLVEWTDGRRDAVVFALEEESDWRRFSPRRLARYCLDIADMYDTNRVVPVTIFLRAAERAPTSLVLGTERCPYLVFKYVGCKLAEMPAERWLGSSNLVARVNLPNMQSAAHDPLDVYHGAVRGLLALEPDKAKQAKARPGGRDLKFIDIYAGLTDNQFQLYRQQHPEEGRIVTGVFQRAHDAGIEQGIEQGIERGIEQGRAEGERAVLERLLKRRFGRLPPEAAERLRRAPEAELETWADNVLDAGTLDEVFQTTT